MVVDAHFRFRVSMTKTGIKQELQMLHGVPPFILIGAGCAA